MRLYSIGVKKINIPTDRERRLSDGGIDLIDLLPLENEEIKRKAGIITITNTDETLKVDVQTHPKEQVMRQGEIIKDENKLLAD